MNSYQGVCMRAEMLPSVCMCLFSRRFSNIVNCPMWFLMVYLTSYLYFLCLYCLLGTEDLASSRDAPGRGGWVRSESESPGPPSLPSHTHTDMSWRVTRPLLCDEEQILDLLHRTEFTLHCLSAILHWTRAVYVQNGFNNFFIKGMVWQNLILHLIDKLNLAACIIEYKCVSYLGNVENVCKHKLY